MKKIITSILCCILIMSVFQVVPEATAFNSVENSISIEKSVVILASVCYQDGELYGIREGSGCFVGAQESECRYILTSSFVTEGYSDWPEDSVKGLFLFIDDEPVLINEKNIKLISEDDDLVLITLPEPIQSGMNLVIDHNVEVKDGDIVYVVGYDGNTITATKEEVKDSFVYQNTVEFYHATTNIALEQWGSPVVTEEGRMVGLCAGAYYDDNQDQVSLNIGIQWIRRLLEKEGIFDTESTASSEGYLLGAWGDNVSTRTSAETQQPAFYLKNPIYDCKELTVEFEITDYTGYPFEYWYLDARDLDGNWIHAGTFKLDDGTVNHMKEYRVVFDKPISFDALTVVSTSKYNSYSMRNNVAYKNAVIPVF